MKINAAKLNKYNANSRGKSVGDCVKRAISIAFDIPYNEVSKLLLKEMKTHKYNSDPEAWKHRHIYGKVIEDLGSSGRVQIQEDRPTLDYFADEIAEPNKTYILEVGKPSRSYSSHLVTVRNNEIWDSWDSSDNIVFSYWTISDNVNHKAITDIADRIQNLSWKYANPLIDAEAKKYMNKKSWEGEFEYRSSKKDYAIKYMCYLKLQPTDLITKERNYTFMLNFVFTPTMTDEDAIEYIEKKAKQQTYDRLYTISKQEEKLIEEYQIRKEIGFEGESYIDSDNMFLTAQEERFIRSLPGWIQPLIKYVQIQNPGMYSDSYRMKIRKLPGDKLHNDVKFIEFEGLDANEIKWEIERYKENHEAPFIDYYPADEW